MFNYRYLPVEHTSKIQTETLSSYLVQLHATYINLPLIHSYELKALSDILTLHSHCTCALSTYRHLTFT